MYTPAVFLLFVQLSVCYGESIPLRLVGGRDASEGNVLVRRGSDWGVVCDDEWDIEDGNVVCRQLGYKKAIKVTSYNKFHSSITDKVFLDDVKCQGYESNLGECMHREWMMSNCNAAEAAGVVCDSPALEADIQQHVPVFRSQNQLIEHPTTSSLRIAIETDSSILGQGALAPTRQVQSESLAPIEDSVPAAYQGYSPRTRELLARVQHLLSPGSFPALESNVQQQQPAYQTLDLSVLNNPSDLYINGVTEDIGAAPVEQADLDAELQIDGAAALTGASGSFIASEVVEPSAGSSGQPAAASQQVSADEIKKIDQMIQEMRLKSDEPSVPAARPYRVEVAGGRRSNEGYVRVTMDNGKMGAICSDNWGIFEAMVVCRQAGKQQAEKATVRDYYGASSQDKVLYEVNCDGHERSFADCEYKLTDRHGVKCSKPMNVAGVVCTSAKLPDLMPNLWALEASLRLEDKPLHTLTCAMEENCLSSSARTVSMPSLNTFGYNSMFGGFNSAPTRRLLRFSSNIFNNGTADFRPKRDRNGWEWHSCHQHYHSMGAFSHYDILDSHGNRVAEGHKASFCLEDVECNWPHTKKYSCRGFADQGISVGCADVYRSDIDCQWIDITDIKPGAYVFKLNVNPEMEVPELSFDNNAAICELTYTGFSAKLSKCAHTRG